MYHWFPVIMATNKTPSFYAEADKIGPVLIKAAYGGGGKGMRVCVTKPTSSSTLRAQNARQPVVLAMIWCIERYVDTPRHVEVQVFADKSEIASTLVIATALCSAVTKK